jgi:VWFA-related protein
MLRRQWLVLLCCLPALCQQHSLTLDVAALDKQGHPVAGLVQTDFTLLDNKHPQKITSFQVVDGAASEPPVQILLVVDEVNDSFINVAHERDQVNVFLQKSGTKLPYPMSVVFFSDKGATVPTEPTLDAETLSADLRQDKNPQHTVTRSQGFYGASDRAQLSLRALGQVAEYETKRPGRKIVIWISPGWPLLSGPHIDLTEKNRQNIFNTIVTLSAAMKQARMDHARFTIRNF